MPPEPENDIAMVANLAQAFTPDYYLHKQRSFRHPNEYLNAGQEPDGVWFNPNALLRLSDWQRECDQLLDCASLVDSFRTRLDRKGRS